jgi:hypothetical protein
MHRRTPASGRSAPTGHHFAGDAASEAAAPVLDALVIKWLGKTAGVVLRPGYSDDYARYADLLGSWGALHGLTLVQVEERIFRPLRDDGA